MVKPCGSHAIETRTHKKDTCMSLYSYSIAIHFFKPYIYIHIQIHIYIYSFLAWKTSNEPIIKSSEPHHRSFPTFLCGECQWVSAHLGSLSYLWNITNYMGCVWVTTDVSIIFFSTNNYVGDISKTKNFPWDPLNWKLDLENYTCFIWQGLSGAKRGGIEWYRHIPWSSK